jgi:di/tricarboxylate transporter
VRSYRDSRDFLLVSPVDDSQPPRHGRARIALAILAAMVLAITFEEYTGIGTLNGALLAAGLMGLTGCCSAGQARRSLDLPVLIAIGAALGIGRAMETSGLADIIAVQVLGLSRGLGPTAVLAATYGLTLLCTELVTNNAAAVLMFPVARAAAAALDVNLMPFAVVVAVAASAGFATPLGYQTHMMVYGPGGYRFMDYVRFGVPLDLVVMVITVALAPVFFPFH